MKHLALAFALTLGVAAPAWAQTAPQAAPTIAGAPQGAPMRAAPTPVTASGNLARMMIGPGGHVRGLVLDNGTVVMLHGPGGDELATRVRVGQPLRIEGFTRPGSAGFIGRATVRSADGTVLHAPPAGPMGPGAMGHGGMDHDGMEHDGMGPGAMGQGGMGRGHHGMGRGWMRGGGMMGQGGPGAMGQGRGGMHGGMRGGMMGARLASLPAQAVNGAVQQVIAGPRGHVRALLFANNVTVYLPRPIAFQLQQRGVRVGESVRASGHGTSTPQGTGFVADQLTFADGARFEAPAQPAMNAPPAAPTDRR